MLVTVGRGQLAVVEWHELLVPHDTGRVHAVRIAVDRGGRGAFVARGQVADVGAVLDRPVGSGLTGGSAQVQPRLAVGSWSVVRHASVRGGHVSVSAAGARVVLVVLRVVRVVVRGHTVLGWTHVWSALRAVDLGESVDVLQLRSSEMSVVSASSASALTVAASTTSVFAVVAASSVLAAAATATSAVAE